MLQRLPTEFPAVQLAVPFSVIGIVGQDETAKKRLCWGYVLKTTVVLRRWGSETYQF